MTPPTLTHVDSGDTLAIGLPGDALEIAGEAGDATWQSIPDRIEKDREVFAYPGTDEVFSRDFGLRTRKIVLRGDVRCTDAGLLIMRVAEDYWNAKVGSCTYEDDLMVYEGCDIVSARLGFNRRRITSEVWTWVVQYEIVLEQLTPW